MKKILTPLLSLLAVTALVTACGPTYETVYTYETPASAHGQLCVQQCQQSKNLCQKMCDAETGECQAAAKASAHEQYQAYVAAQKGSDKPLARTEASFYKAPKCNSEVCHCEADMAACVELCGGRAVPSRHCVANCGTQQAAPVKAAETNAKAVTEADAPAVSSAATSSSEAAAAERTVTPADSSDANATADNTDTDASDSASSQDADSSSAADASEAYAMQDEYAQSDESEPYETSKVAFHHV